MDYEIKKSSENYLERSSGLYNKVVAGVSGLALLVSGCIDTVNGVRIRAEEKTKFKVEIVDPFAEKEKKKENDTNYLLIGGIILGAGAVGTGVYFLGEDQGWWGGKDRRSPDLDLETDPGSGEGENGGGPGGQWKNYFL